MVGFVVLFSVGSLAWGLRARTTGDHRFVSRVLGAILLVVWVLYNVYYFHPAVFAWPTSLPLHTCDVLGLLGGAVLLWPFPSGRAVLFSSALGMASQAIFTPTGDQDPLSLRFWLYWTLHAGIVAAMLFDLAVNRYEPRWRDLRFVLFFDVIYLAIVLPIDLVFDWNYGYLGRQTPGETTLLDVLGPWPLRAVNVVLIALLVQLAMFGLWCLGKRLLSGDRCNHD